MQFGANFASAGLGGLGGAGDFEGMSVAIWFGFCNGEAWRHFHVEFLGAVETWLGGGGLRRKWPVAIWCRFCGGDAWGRLLRCVISITFWDTLPFCGLVSVSDADDAILNDLCIVCLAVGGFI